MNLVDKLINKINKKNDGIFKSLSQKSTIYGDIYFPYYNLNCTIDSKTPEIYNKNGEKMDVFFLRDKHSAHIPYGNQSKYFIWDRYDIGLDTHFYSHEAMLETMGSPKKKIGVLIESEDIVPEDYKMFEKNKELNKDFDLILTYSEEILDKIDNAKYFPWCSSVWYGQEPSSNAIISDKAYQNKTREISMVCSDKTVTKYHKIRHNFASKVKDLSNVDIFGKFNGGSYVRFKSDTLKDYRYQIVVENGIYPYYFTEKIMDCFASMTIPVYLGASKIDNFFNPDGIIKLKENDAENIENILLQCNEKGYEQRIPAIIDNFNRVQKYLNIEDLLYEEFFLNK